MQEIDYSHIPAAPGATVTEETWEPPPHKYFGPKDPKTGKRLPEPVYQHQEYPRTVYAKKEGKIIARLVRSQEEFEALIASKDGWTKDLGSLGYVGAPSFEQALGLKKVAEAEAAARPQQPAPTVQEKPVKAKKVA